MEVILDFRDGMFDELKRMYLRFDRVDAKLVEHDERFERLEFHYGSLDRRVGRIETRLEDVERRLPA